MAAINHTLTFTNGTLAEPVTLPVGTYEYVSNTVAGYRGGTVQEFTITPTTTAVEVKISGAGTLTVTVKDDLNDPITSGKLQLSNQDGSTAYGAEVNISDGIAAFDNVPYISGTGISTYIKQNATDKNHVAITTPQSVSLANAAQTATVENARLEVPVNFTAMDLNYAGITPVTGDIVVIG